MAEELSKSPPLRSALKQRVASPDPIPSSTSSLTLPSSPQLEPTRSSSNPPQYERKVGFDTLDNDTALKTGGGTGLEYSFTLQAESLGYTRTRTTRTFLVATDLNEYSVGALDWLLENLVEDGDQVVVLRVIESTTPSPSQQDFEGTREEAQNFMDGVMNKIQHKRTLSIVIEFIIGKVEETIHRMINLYRPDSLIVGTRGREDNWKTAFIGSVSRYCLASSPVPVVVVRPEDKVLQAKAKRRSKSSLYGALLAEKGYTAPSI